MGSQFRIFIGFLSVLFIVFSFSLMLISYSGELTLPIILIIILAFMICANILFYSLRRKRFDIFEPIYIFSAIYFILFVLRPLYIILAGDYDFLHLIGASDEYFSPVLLTLIFGYLAFSIGYNIKSKIINSILNKLPKVNDNEIVKSKIIISLLFLSFIGLITYVYFYGFKLTQTTSVDVFRESTAYLYYGLDLMVPAVIIAFLLRRKSLYFKIVFFSMSFISIYIFMGMHARYRWIAMILSIFFLYYIQKDKRPKVFNVLLISSLVLMAFALTGIFRGILKTGIDFGTVLEAIKSRELILRFLSSQGDTAMFDFLVLYFQEIPKNINYLYGLGFLQLFIHPIPRLIWETKPIQPSAYFMSEILPEFYENGVGFASSIFGDLYWNFGIIGIIIGMFLAGLFLKTVYLWFIKNKDVLSVQIIYAFILSFVPMYMRGEFVGTSAWFLFMFVPTLIILKISKRKIKLRMNNYYAV